MKFYGILGCYDRSITGACESRSRLRSGVRQTEEQAASGARVSRTGTPVRAAFPQMEHSSIGPILRGTLMKGTGITHVEYS